MTSDCFLRDNLKKNKKIYMGNIAILDMVLIKGGNLKQTYFTLQWSMTRRCKKAKFMYENLRENKNRI